ncbi:uncharacterized protein LOC110726943 [Chenopodium quinoa]|uniref:uncharacterized protein LOC110726943 n=1 Tax=Chenopodium quinoa TaxID=63459 RepID=UPI000B7818E9|nr:uncharacterized protein LOC110726943 [Chenopodium quinoa]
MEGKNIAVCVIAGVLGLIAVVMGFVAEATKVKGDQVLFTEDGACFYPTSPSVALGIVASIILLIQQILISGASGCFCCRGNPCPSTCSGITALICFIFSWLVFIGAFVMLMYAAILNTTRYLVDTTNTLDEGCLVPKSGFFIAAGVLSIISIALGLVAYIVLISSDKKIIPKGGASNVASEYGIATAKPQIPTNV